MRIKRVSFVLAVIVAGTLAGCEKSDEPAPSAAATAPAKKWEATTQPSANAAFTEYTVRLSEGVNIDQVKDADAIKPAFQVTPGEDDTTVIMAVRDSDPGDSAVPVLARKINGTWKVATLTGLAQHEWMYGGTCDPRHEAWGILDSSTEDRAEALTLIRSTDEGASWSTFAAVKKPVKDAEFFSLVMAENGTGRLTMHLDDDTDGVVHGFYHYQTTDGGRTWTGPTREPNDAGDGDGLDDVDTLKEAIKNVDQPPAN